MFPFDFSLIHWQRLGPPLNPYLPLSGLELVAESSVIRISPVSVRLLLCRKNVEHVWPERCAIIVWAGEKRLHFAYKNLAQWQFVDDKTLAVNVTLNGATVDVCDKQIRVVVNVCATTEPPPHDASLLPQVCLKVCAPGLENAQVGFGSAKKMTRVVKAGRLTLCMVLPDWYECLPADWLCLYKVEGDKNVFTTHLGHFVKKMSLATKKTVGSCLMKVYEGTVEIPDASWLANSVFKIGLVGNRGHVQPRIVFTETVEIRRNKSIWRKK